VLTKRKAVGPIGWEEQPNPIIFREGSKMNKKSFFRKKMEAIIKEHGLKNLKEVVKFQKKTGQRGFTLLELLVVVAILAAIAGTATIALQDTDARAAAAAHVAMMDEMNKGIRTFRVLRGNEYPGGFDSLVQVDDAALANPTLLDTLADSSIFAVQTLSVANYGMWASTGFNAFGYVAEDQQPDGYVSGSFDCGVASGTSLAALIESKQNAIVPGNIFLSANGNGCGVRADVTDDLDNNGTADDPGYFVTSQAAGAAPVTAAGVTAALPIAVWNGGAERLTGQAEAGAYNAEGNTAFMAVGIGPASNLFEANVLGGMTSVPTYRHVKGAEYNRFFAIWDIGTYAAAAPADGILFHDHPQLTTIVDSAGDTKEEELGEWDGTRNTI
jgi:prepilin-type N-terminal cleavage/methylation domain-containing protein